MRPTQRCLLIFLVGFAAAALPVLVSGAPASVWLLWVGLVALSAGVDALLGLPTTGMEVELSAPGRLYVGAEDRAGVHLSARRRGAVADLFVLCDLSENLRPHEEIAATLPAGGSTDVDIPLVPLRRGTAVITRTWIRWTGPLGLMQRRIVKEHALDIPVVPDIGAVRAAALQFASRREVTTGARSIRFIGQGSEFDAMREYVPGLDHRSISWKGSARHRRLVCQEYRAERNHQVVIAIDTGHLMAEPLGGIPKLDHAIHASLVLAYTCLRVGDRVGLYAFDEGVRAFASPSGGISAFARIQHLTAGLDYASAETNFTLGLAELSSRLHRRSLIVILTDFVDTITAELMVENAARLARRHLLMFVSFRDMRLADTAEQAPASLDALCESVVAADFVRERELVLRRLERLGIRTVDAPPGRITSSLLNRYLAIKQRELI